MLPIMVETTYWDLRELSSAPDADAVVVVDVLRAFSTAAVAFGGGAAGILPVLDVGEAFERRSRDPGLVLMGESNCLPVPGFDLGNSPVAAAAFLFQGKWTVQRTTAGTRGLVTCAGADSLWAASFLVAEATARALLAKRVRRVAFVVTGTVHYGHAEEDLACAEWIAELLNRRCPPIAPFLERVRTSVAASGFLDPSNPLYAPADVEACARADAFTFALKAKRSAHGLELAAHLVQ